LFGLDTGIRRGYGRLRHNGEDQYVHRLMWLTEKGEIRKGLHICHHCDNPPCCNVDHLFMGTSGDNQRDAYRKGRHRRSRAVLTEVDVSLIKYFLQNGWSCAELGRRYGVSRTTIGDIKGQRNWRHTRPFQPEKGEPLPVPPPLPPGSE
jgi:HNH endonuclease